MHSSCWRISEWSRAGTEVGLVADYRTVVYKRAAIALNFFQFKTYQLALKVRVVGDWTLPCLGRFFRSSVFSNVSSSALLAWLATTIENLADEFECWMGPNLTAEWYKIWFPPISHVHVSDTECCSSQAVRELDEHLRRTLEAECEIWTEPNL
jgi:hypothetical protein